MRASLVPSMGILVSAFALVRCGGPGAAPLAAACVSRFDCAAEEICSAGHCVPSTSDNAATRSTSPDAATSPPVSQGGDAGVMSRDAGAADAARSVDAGSAPADSGAAPDTGSAPDATPRGPADAGCPGRAVEVMGFGQYCTIGQAVAAAPSGATVIVPAAPYSESVEISKPLTLIGAGDGSNFTPMSSIFGAPGTTALRLSGTAGPIAVQGFAISAAGGVVIEAMGQVSISNVSITTGTGAGVRVQGSGTVATLDQMMITSIGPDSASDGIGVDCGSGTSCTISNSLIEYTYSVGVQAYNATVVMHGTQVLNTGQGTCLVGPDECFPGVFGDSNAAITMDQQSEVSDSGGPGFSVINGAALTLLDSTVTYNGSRDDIPGDGIYLWNSTNVTIDRSNISNNRHYGVDCDVGANAQCGGNVTHTSNGSWTNCSGC